MTTKTKGRPQGSTQGKNNKQCNVTMPVAVLTDDLAQELQMQTFSAFTKGLIMNYINERNAKRN